MRTVAALNLEPATGLFVFPVDLLKDFFFGVVVLF